MSKQAELIKYLNKLTLAGKLKWAETVEEDVFQASFPEYSIQITETPTTADGADPQAIDIVISIFNGQGKKVEAFRDWEVSTEGGSVQPYKTMNETYVAARRQALGTDEAYDHLLSELRDLDLPF